MVNLADSMVSSSARKMPIRKRGDLQARKQHYQGRAYWVVKDPVGLQYFRFQEEEYAILQMLDGETSLDEIKDRFEEEFPPQKITLEELHQFIGMLHRSGLILSVVPGQADQLLKRRGERKWREFLSALTNILSLRFKGIDPERLLDWMMPLFQWMFHPITVMLSLTLMASAGLLVLVQFDTFRSKLPEFHQFFTASNAVWLAIMLGATKICHEFGHGLSCKHFGGECHELGVMFLVLTPCLYCNVSDSWMLPNKWHRVIIGGAGMYVEMILASICTFVWWFSQPGLLNNLCLNVMFISSVSTLIFNGNPLLRYDGYYMLADMLEIPNLRQKATQILSRKSAEWFLGMEQQPDPFLPQQNQVLFAIYAVASAIYRWVVVISIMLFLYKIWKPYKLEVIGRILVGASLYGMFIYPLYRVGKFFYVPGRLDKVKKPRMYASAAVAAAIVAFVLFVPLPCRVYCTLEVQARDAGQVYVDVAGILERQNVHMSDRVSKGDTIAELKSVDLELEINKLTGMREQFTAQLASLHHRRFTDPKAGSEIPQVVESLETVKNQLAEKQQDLKRLRLVAPRDGIVMPPSPKKKHEDPEGPLPAWSGTPIEPENRGAYLEAGSLYCEIGDPLKMEAILVIDQTDYEFIQKGQKVEICLAAYPHDVWKSQVSDKAEIDLKVAPQRLSSKANGELLTKTDPDSGVERPMNTSYQARVPLDDPNDLLCIGMKGQAKVVVPWMSLGHRFWRFLTRTFHFEL